MKALKITLLLVAVLLLTVSGVQSDVVTQHEDPTYKEYTPKQQFAINKKKLKLSSQA